MGVLAHLNARSPWGGRQLSSIGCCLIIDLHILHAYVHVFVFGYVSLIVKVCCINSRAMFSVLSRCSPPPYHFHTWFYFFSPPPRTLLRLLFLKSLFPSRRDGATACRPALWFGVCLWPGDRLQQVLPRPWGNLWRQHDLQPQNDMPLEWQGIIIHEIVTRKVCFLCTAQRTNVWIFLQLFLCSLSKQALKLHRLRSHICTCSSSRSLCSLQLKSSSPKPEIKEPIFKHLSSALPFKT